MTGTVSNSRVAALARVGSGILSLVLSAGAAVGHEGHRDRTYEVTPSADPADGARTVSLEITDGETGEALPARFAIRVDGERWAPEFLDEAGIRFVSIHERKKQTEVILYSRGEGPLRFGVPEEAKELEITAIRGLEWAPKTVGVTLTEVDTVVAISLDRMVDLESRGWFAADTHLHYARLDPAHDRDWLAMLDADGLHHGVFMMLDGANIRGRWAEQYAYGAAGEAGNERQRIFTGEEFRCTMQGHINLFGAEKVIEPVSIGGLGGETHPWNTPATFRVMERVREHGGISGPAHGGTMAKVPTTMRDAVLGGSEFFEIANTFALWTDYWYRALNCGLLLPPVAGTDLPNFPQREDWQPFLGDVRTYARSGSPAFEDWKAGLRANRVFVSSGPLLASFTVEGRPALGEQPFRLGQAGKVTVRSEIVSARPVATVELIRNGEAEELEFDSEEVGGIHRISVEREVSIERSSWIALRATGLPKARLFRESSRLAHAMLHTGAVPVLVGKEPIRDEAAVAKTREELRAALAAYEEEGTFPDEASRREARALFEEALRRLGGGE